MNAPAAPATITRSDALDADMVETVAALANAYHQHIDVERPPLTPGQLAAAAFDNTTIQRYLGAFYPSGHHDLIAEWTWTLDQARHAGLG